MWHMCAIYFTHFCQSAVKCCCDAVKSDDDDEYPLYRYCVMHLNICLFYEKTGCSGRRIVHSWRTKKMKLMCNYALLFEFFSTPSHSSIRGRDLRLVSSGSCEATDAG